MTHDSWKVLHLAGVFLVLFSLGGATFAALSGIERKKWKLRKWAAIGHGVGMLTIFAAGVGMAVAMGLPHPWAAWLNLKIGIWLLVGASFGLVWLSPKRIGALIVLLAAAAAYLAIYKPAL